MRPMQIVNSIGTRLMLVNVHLQLAISLLDTAAIVYCYWDVITKQIIIIIIFVISSESALYALTKHYCKLN